MAALACSMGVMGVSLVRFLSNGPLRKSPQGRHTKDNDGPITHEEYFRRTESPIDEKGMEKKMSKFVRSHLKAGRKIVCVTGGGTTVPLEKNTVRFIDNFSTGTRAAISVEYFLKKGYAVLYLRRKGSVDAFARHIQKDLKSRYVDHNLLSSVALDAKGKNVVSLELTEATVDNIRQFHTIKEKGLLQSVEFESCDEYFFLLRLAARATQLAGSNGMMYFSAAVSDFFMTDQPTHKIQSRDGPLHLVLQQTPKLELVFISTTMPTICERLLGVLRSSWAPEVFCVSFKLETDLNLLIKKAQRAIAKYGMDAVVANELHSRYREVSIVQSSKIEVLKVETSQGREIEDAIVDYLIKLHSRSS